MSRFRGVLFSLLFNFLAHHAFVVLIARNHGLSCYGCGYMLWKKVEEKKKTAIGVGLPKRGKMQLHVAGSDAITKYRSDIRDVARFRKSQYAQAVAIPVTGALKVDRPNETLSMNKF